MVAGIILIVLGFLLIAFSVLVLLSKGKMTDDLAWGLGFIFVVGAIMMYNGGMKIDQHGLPSIEKNIEK